MIVTLALVVSLIDIRHEPSALDRNMVQFLMDAADALSPSR